jgi:hypothetical protein
LLEIAFLDVLSKNTEGVFRCGEMLFFYARNAHLGFVASPLPLPFCHSEGIVCPDLLRPESQRYKKMLFSR